jgi:hypothetical protein
MRSSPGVEHPSSPGRTDEPHRGEKATYKSWKKKFRKMKLRFDHSMSKSNTLYKQEQEAAETAHRLAIENDQLLDLLLDLNNTPQIPSRLRIDLTLDSPVSFDIPSLAYDMPAPRDGPLPPEAQAIHDQLHEAIKARRLTYESNPPQRSLKHLLSTVPHATLHTLPPSREASISGIHSPQSLTFADPEHPKPLTYLSPDDIDEYIAQVDASLDLPGGAPKPTSGGPGGAEVTLGRLPTRHLSDKDLQVKNPNSVYNWLRHNEPKIFLQDGEVSDSKSATAKPGSLRGAGKRGSIPAARKSSVPVEAAAELAEEEYDGSVVGVGASASAKRDSKRKRASLDDAGYRPKGGASRPAKKKKKEGSGDRGSGRVKVEADADAGDAMDVEAAS